MPSTPIFAIPYPTDSDLVKDGNEAIQAVAERVELIKAGGIAAGFQSASITAVQSNGTAAISPISGIQIVATLQAGRKYRAMGLLPLNMLDATGFCEGNILDNGVKVAAAQVPGSITAGSFANVFAIISPSSTASHTLNLGCAASTGRIQVSASATMPCTLTLECVA